ncbi:MAG TPA: hypothetical protein VFX21_02865 [Acidimicrobiia bacterium]|nr:hypothetical protein [Acidimicrobiia bacterium]
MTDTMNLERVRDEQYRRIMDVVVAGPRHRATALARDHLAAFPDDDGVRLVLERLEGRTRPRAHLRLAG